MNPKKIMLIIITILLIPIILLGGEILFAKKGGVEEFKNPSNDPRNFGESGEELTYLILGDSTSAGQGTSNYENGIAVSTAKYLAKNHKVKLVNFSISGATTQDLKDNQLSKALEYKPDLVLISAGSNDITHLKSVSNIKENIIYIVNKLIEKNCKVKIIVTGSADVGSSPRFLEPLSSIITFRVKQVNKKAFAPVIAEYDLTFAPIAKETAPVFKKDRSLFANDRYHPNDEGYKVWNNVIYKAIDEAMAKQSNYCK